MYWWTEGENVILVIRKDLWWEILTHPLDRILSVERVHSRNTVMISKLLRGSVFRPLFFSSCTLRHISYVHYRKYELEGGNTPTRVCVSANTPAGRVLVGWGVGGSFAPFLAHLGRHNF